VNWIGRDKQALKGRKRVSGIGPIGLINPILIGLIGPIGLIEDL
jgi:hypothetical protein